MKQLAAALIFFTRLPLWRVVRVPDACYRRVVAYWSATGWLTAAVTAGVLYGAAFLLPVPAAVLAAVIARVLLTGALHEDGLSDFLDGFGGGNCICSPSIGPQAVRNPFRDRQIGQEMLTEVFFGFYIHRSLRHVISAPTSLCLSNRFVRCRN